MSELPKRISLFENHFHCALHHVSVFGGHLHANEKSCAMHERNEVYVINFIVLRDVSHVTRHTRTKIATASQKSKHTTSQ
jgi:hypothetical protein